jgi:transketolase
MRGAFFQALTALAEQDARVCLIVGDLGFGVVETFARRFPDRFLNAGVA